MITQEEMIASYMRANGSITSMQAMRDLGVMRLASRIHDMRVRGIEIETETISVKNRYGNECKVACYRLVEREA